MARKGRSSIVQEVKVAVTSINHIGESKREARMQKKKTIHSIKQVKETLSAAQNFAKWVRKKHQIKSVYQLEEMHYYAYLHHKKEEGRSAGHLQNIETSLRHLQEGMNIRSEKLDLEPVLFTPKKRVIAWEELKKPEDRSYTKEEFEVIVSMVSEGVKDAILLGYYMGLRVRETTTIQVQHFQREDNQLWLAIENGKGITKGGRFRKTPVPSYFEHELLRMLEGKEEEERLVSVQESTVRKGVYNACKKAKINQKGRGTHGFRHSYCRRRLRELLTVNGMEREGTAMMKRIMTNRDQGRAADYGILMDTDRIIYAYLKEAIDQVHSEIGHGKDRWDLGERYLR